MELLYEPVKSKLGSALCCPHTLFLYASGTVFVFIAKKWNMFYLYVCIIEFICGCIETPI